MSLLPPRQITNWRTNTRLERMSNGETVGRWPDPYTSSKQPRVCTRCRDIDYRIPGAKRCVLCGGLLRKPNRNDQKRLGLAAGRKP